MLQRRNLRDFDWFFDRLFPERMKPMFDSGTFWVPDVEVLERGNDLIVRADVPGMKKDEIVIEFTDRALTLKGERKREKEEKGEDFYRSEREYGSFYRTIPLPEGVKFDDAKAIVKDGVLEIKMPLAKAVSATRRLEIKEAPAAETPAKHAA
jgi:HSP20 family protein